MLVAEIIPPQNFAAGCSLYPSQSHQNCLTSMKIAFREWLMMFWEELVIIISPECVMKLWSWCVTQSPVSWPWPGVRPSASAWAGGEWREYKTISPPWPEYSPTPILHTNWTGTRLATSNDYAISYHCLDSNHSDESRLPKISRDKICDPLEGILCWQIFNCENFLEFILFTWLSDNLLFFRRTIKSPNNANR